jgi:hypothetical protein
MDRLEILENKVEELEQRLSKLENPYSTREPREEAMAETIANYMLDGILEEVRDTPGLEGRTLLHKNITKYFHGTGFMTIKLINKKILISALNPTTFCDSPLWDYVVELVKEETGCQMMIEKYNPISTNNGIYIHDYMLNCFRKMGMKV